MHFLTPFYGTVLMSELRFESLFSCALPVNLTMESPSDAEQEGNLVQRIFRCNDLPNF